MNNTLID